MIPGRPLDSVTREGIQRLVQEGCSRRETAREMDACKRTVDKYAREIPRPDHKNSQNGPQ